MSALPRTIMMARILLASGMFHSIIFLTVAGSMRENYDSLDILITVNRSTDINHTAIINFYNEHKNEFVLNDLPKEVVLVMGNTGAGKTTLISAIVGRKIRVVDKDGDLIFEDEDGNIGTGISSQTLLPTLITDIKNDVNYIDCAGFRDNRDIEHEVSSVYFQKILMNQIEQVKLILVINHESLTVNGNKNDFDDLFEHIGELIKNTSMIHNGIALVATKVENRYRKGKNGTLILTNDDQTVLKGIENYLNEKRKIYSTKITSSEKYRMFVDLIDVLVEKNTDSYVRIALFRKPTDEGPIEDLPKTKEEINTISNMTINNLLYVKTKKDDFRFAISKSLKNTIDQIVNDIYNDTLKNSLQKIGNDTLLNYRQIENELSDILVIQKRMSQAYNRFFNIKNINESESLFHEFFNAANGLKVFLSLSDVDFISEELKKLFFFTTMTDSNKDLHMLSIKNEMANFIDSMESLKNFYDFLNNLYEKLSTHQSQKLKDDKRIENIIYSCMRLTNPTIQNIANLEDIVKEIGSESIYQKIKTLVLNASQFKHLKAVFFTFATQLEHSCSPSGQMIVKGYNVRMSDIIKIDCWSNATIIQIFALNKVFIDCTIDKVDAKAQVFIIAPTWEVVGGPKIMLNGKAGARHQQESAKSSSFNSENGSIGLPGLPGGSAGHFFGIGRQFLNLEYLEINTNGGTGGPGQHGGNGANGIPGTALSELFFDAKRLPEENKKYFTNNDFVHEWKCRTTNNEMTVRDDCTGDVLGKLAKKPSDGGDGGAGGRGGYAGSILINSLGKLVNAKLSNHSGSTGEHGRGGRGGEKTSNGRRVKFGYSYRSTPIPFVWFADYFKIKWSNGAEIPPGKDGNPGTNRENQEHSTVVSRENRWPIINNFKNFVRANIFENLRESELKSFVFELESDKEIKSEYTTLAFVKELEGLEDQFFNLKDKIDFTPFYDSLRSRIEEFAKSEKSLENKKVLNYIYSATLTKLFSLKKKRKGQTVVNLSNYLGIIESNVKEIQESQHLQVVQSYRDDYKYSLEKKIKDAKNLIQTKIEPEINALWEKSDDQLKAIIDEINKNRNETNQAIEVLDKEKSKIRHNMEWRATLFPLKLVGAGLSFLGPIGAGVGTVVAGVASIAEGMVIDTTPGNKPSVPKIIPDSKEISRVTNIFDSENKQLVEKQTLVIMKLEEYINDLCAPEPKKVEKRNTIRKLKTQVEEIKSRKIETLSDVACKKNDTNKINQQLIEFTNLEKDILEKQKILKDKSEEEKQREKSLNQIKQVKIMINSTKVVFDFIKNINSDQRLMNAVDSQIAQYYQQLRDLEKMEQQVYDIILPELRQIEETINEIKISSEGSSHVTLDITKWKIRSTLQDLKSLLMKFTQKMSFELQSDLRRYVEKIDEGFSIIIDVYDRIDSYMDSVKQVECIANIVSATMTNINIADEKLSRAVTDLKLTIHSNILFEKYNIALHAFKQHFFPFAAHVLKTFQLPTGLQRYDVNSLRFVIIASIQKMRNHVNENEAIMGDYLKYIHEKKIFNSNTSSSSPFYVWKHDSIKNEIQQLLNGSQVLLKADISEGLFYNSVKYNDIGINLKLSNTTLQNHLTSLLTNFKLIMTMVGNSYYRCGERYYSISIDDDITISYNLDQNESKEWIDPNKVYTTIRRSHIFLSPYVMWSIKLENLHESVSFNQLNSFKNEVIDIELFGQGYYIEQNDEFNFEVCNGYLDTFYDV